ncbi:SAP domain-containing protein [Pycnococcus provasolii]
MSTFVSSLSGRKCASWRRAALKKQQGGPSSSGLSWSSCRQSASSSFSGVSRVSLRSDSSSSSSSSEGHSSASAASNIYAASADSISERLRELAPEETTQADDDDNTISTTTTPPRDVVDLKPKVRTNSNADDNDNVVRAAVSEFSINPPQLLHARIQATTVVKLKAFCKTKSMKVSGNKAQLVERVFVYINAQPVQQQTQLLAELDDAAASVKKASFDANNKSPLEETLRYVASTRERLLNEGEGTSSPFAVKKARAAMRRLRVAMRKIGVKEGIAAVSRCIRQLGNVRDLDVISDEINQLVNSSRMSLTESERRALLKATVRLSEMRKRRARKAFRTLAEVCVDKALESLRHVVPADECDVQTMPKKKQKCKIKVKKNQSKHIRATLASLSERQAWNYTWKYLSMKHKKGGTSLGMHPKRLMTLHDLRKQARDARYVLEAAAAHVAQGEEDASTLTAAASQLEACTDALGTMRDVEELSDFLGESDLWFGSFRAECRLRHKEAWKSFEEARAPIVTQKGFFRKAAKAAVKA